MAVIDAYRIGVEVVLGGDFAAGIEALIPALKGLDNPISQTVAGVLGQAEDGVGTAPYRTGTIAGLPKDTPTGIQDVDFGDGDGNRSKRGLGFPGGGPDVPGGLGAGDRSGVALKPAEWTVSGFEVVQALLAGEFVKSNVAGRLDGQSKRAEQLADGRAPETVLPVGIVRVSMLGADAAKGISGVYASARNALPVYVRDAWALGDPGLGSVVEPVLGSGRGFDGGRVEEVEEVMPTLTRRGRSGAEALVELHPLVQQPLPMTDDSLAPLIRVPGAEMPVRERMAGMLAGPSLAVEELSATGTASQPHAKGPIHALASTREAVQGLDIAILSRTPNMHRTAIEGLSSGVIGLGASSAKDGLVDRTATEGRGALFTLAGSFLALDQVKTKMLEGWLSAAKAAAAVEVRTPGAVGTGFMPPFIAPDRDQGMGVTPYAQSYHPEGIQPGPVIQHITYLHLDDREIARSVTRQQLRMMGGHVSSTLRPDPSLAPQYGAHLVET